MTPLILFEASTKSAGSLENCHASRAAQPSCLLGSRSQNCQASASLFYLPEDGRRMQPVYLCVRRG